MLAKDEDALICDMAETYHVFNMRELPVRTWAALAAGLGPDSRIARKLSGNRITGQTALLACAVDGINTLIWMNTKDGHKNRNRPQSILEQLLAQPEKKDRLETFASGEEFERARERILRKGG